MGLPGAIQRNSKKIFYGKKSSNPQKNFKNFFIFQGLIRETKLPQDLKNPQINSKDNFYVLNNNFSYTQLSFLFLLQKDSYYLYDDTDVFFLFLLQKDFDIFCVLPFKVFFFNFFLWYLFTIFIFRKNIYKKYFY